MIFKFLFVIFMVGLLTVGVFLFGIFVRVRSALNGFSKNEPGRQHGQEGARRRTSDEEIITDRRSPADARQKIIPKDEGEYVDFKEE